jgi:murein DD-endopeptidase MepM/ murein hydrolase activator NlpD
MVLEQRFSRRRFLQFAAAGSGALVLARAPLPKALAATELVNPYSGAIPLAFPLAQGTYEIPVQNTWIDDNWHSARQGDLYTWNHRAGTAARAHDGVDAYPLDATALPPVYAPVEGMVAAVCVRSANTIVSPFTYVTSQEVPPPWNFSEAIDSVIQVPLYGNFVWIYSTETASLGYYVFLTHLQNESTLQALAVALRENGRVNVTRQNQLGVMGDTGNAVGAPQLHVEVHYPRGASFSCTRCTPEKTLTAINPYPSLVNAAVRPPVDLALPRTRRGWSG